MGALAAVSVLEGARTIMFSETMLRMVAHKWRESTLRFSLDDTLLMVLIAFFGAEGTGSLTSFSEGRMVRSSMVRMKSEHGGKRKCENEPSTSLTVNREHVTVTLCAINKDM